MLEKKSTKWLVRMGVFVAIIVLMSFTPIGYLKVGAIEITFLMIPVSIGAIVLGERSGAILGGVWGLTSFIQCFGMSAFGAALLGINPILTFITCMIPRILVGYLTGLIFKVLRKSDKTKNVVSFVAASLAAPIINTLLFIVFVIVFFGGSDFIVGLRDGRNLLAFFVWFVGLNGLIEAIVAFVVGGAISKAVYRYATK